MNVLLIGERSERNRLIAEVCGECGAALEAVTPDSELLFEQITEFDAVIFDLPYLRKSGFDFQLSVQTLCRQYHGIVIVYAPNADYTDETLRLFYRSGYTKVIRDYLPSSAKKKLKDYLTAETDNANPTFSPVRAEQPSVDSISNVQRKIGVIGIMPRIGTTTQAVQIVKALTALGKKACYICENDTAFLDSMELFFSNIRKETDKGRLLYHDTVFYKDKNYAYSQDFDYLVFDYGNCTRNDGIPNDFYSNDFRVVVCGGNAEEVAALTQLSRQLYSDEQMRYVFSFIDEQEQAEVLDLMGDRAEMVYFAPYVPDCFREYEQSILLCRRLLALQEEPPIGKKRGFGRKRRR